MIVVATADFEVYHDVVAELRDRDVEFTTIEPGDPVPESATVLIVAADEDPTPAGAELPADVGVVEAAPDEARAAVESALELARGEGGRVVVGVDPGVRPGVAVFVGDTVVAAFQVPLAQAADLIRSEIEDAPDPVVRIGDGARIQGSRLVDELEDVRVELVDETGTTPSLGAGASGAGDLLAAVNIAHREGSVIDARDIDPTAGEVQRIVDQSREAGGDNRAIDEVLARRVAQGELTVDEALEEHREGG